jgi:hypothetical protein
MKLALFLSYTVSLCSFEFYQTEATLSAIEHAIKNQQPGAYLRFGDGDLLVMNRVRSDSHQIYNDLLKNELQEAIQLTGPHIFKCLPLHIKEFGGFEEGMFPGNHESTPEICHHLLDLAKNYWNPIDKVYSPVVLAFAATQFPDRCLDFLLFLKNSNPLIFIGNQNIPNHLKTLLFGSQCNFIKTPEHNAYTEIDIIEYECNRILSSSTGYQVIITSMGISGRALQKRLYKNHNNIFLFDFGSLMDALSEAWIYSPYTQKRAWIDLTHFDSHQFLEKLKERNQKFTP